MSRSEAFPGVLECDPYEVTPEDFERLAVGGPDGLNMIWEKELVPPEEVQHMIGVAKQLEANDGGLRDYTNDVRDGEGKLVSKESYGVGISGAADPYSFCFETPQGSPQRRQYQAKVPGAMETYTELSKPYPWIGLAILAGWDKLHPAGARRPNLEPNADGEAEAAGIGMLRTTLALAKNPASAKLATDRHIDVVPPEVIRELCELPPEAFTARIIELLRRHVRMISENRYLIVPELNGEIFSAPAGKDGPCVMIKPRPGDGIKIRTTDFHGVIPSPFEDRLSGQAFGAILLTPDGKAIDRNTSMVGWS